MEHTTLEHVAAARSEDNRVLVAGAGPVGMIAALGLARAGLAVTLIGPASREDRRTTALMRPALAYLGGLGVLAPIEEEAAPLSTMRIVDGTDRLVRSPVVTFPAAEIGEQHFGLNIPNRALNAALEAAVDSESLIEWRKSMVKTWLPDADRVVVVLVPLVHLAFGHRRLDDRHDLVEPVPGDDEAADMLGEMAGAPENFVGAVDHMARARVGPVEAAGLCLRLAHSFR